MLPFQGLRPCVFTDVLQPVLSYIRDFQDFRNLLVWNHTGGVQPSLEDAHSLRCSVVAERSGGAELAPLSGVILALTLPGQLCVWLNGLSPVQQVLFGQRLNGDVVPPGLDNMVLHGLESVELLPVDRGPETVQPNLRVLHCGYRNTDACLVVHDHQNLVRDDGGVAGAEASGSEVRDVVSLLHEKQRVLAVLLRLVVAAHHMVHIDVGAPVQVLPVQVRCTVLQFFSTGPEGEVVDLSEFFPQLQLCQRVGFCSPPGKR